jgi:nucleotide-binding universal stress UspA family protein
MMQLTRILVAVNTTNGRDAAFERALSLARASGAELYVLHAVPASGPFSAHAGERLERTLALRARAEEAGVRVQTVEQHGEPAEIIELHAEARDVDLIVMGSEPSRGWSRRRRSRVAERVLRRTRRPTLVVAGDRREDDVGFRRVLAAVDLFPGSANLLRRALALTADEPSQVTVMHTVTGLEAAGAVQSLARWTVPEYRTHVLDDARREVEGLVSTVSSDVEVQVRIATGSAAQGILDHAAEVNADLIVVGKSRGFRPLGSTALRLLRRNARALLVVPSTDARRLTAVEGDRAA